MATVNCSKDKKEVYEQIKEQFVSYLRPYFCNSNICNDSNENRRSNYDQIVLGYSGGVDSTVLLHLLSLFREQNRNLNCQYLVVHVNHNLNANCHQWVIHCREQALKYGFNFEVVSVQLNDATANIEGQARQLRYQALQSFITNRTILLTAQHQDDQVETFLLALKRGSGPKGLAAMPIVKPIIALNCRDDVTSKAQRHSQIYSESELPQGLQYGLQIRPLLHSSKKQIYGYALAHELGWINDESNQNVYFERNFLRLNVLPQLIQRWPSFIDTATRSISLIAQEHKLLEQLLIDKLQDVCDQGRLNCSKLQKLDGILVLQLIRLWLQEYPMNRYQKETYLPTQKQLQCIYHDFICSKIDSRPCFETSEYQLRRSYGFLYKLPKFNNIRQWHSLLTIDQMQQLPDSLGQIGLLSSIPSFHLAGSAGMQQTTYSVMQVRSPYEHEQISIRFNGTGIYCQPVGHRQLHRLKEIYQSYRIPSWQRSRLPLLFYNEQLMAVADLFIHVGAQSKDTRFTSYFLWQR